MREITTHKTNACNEDITITADERDEKYGNASHAYEIQWVENVAGICYTLIDFQHGPIKEVGVNGITNEALLAILIDRMEGFQSGPFACDHNQKALEHLKAALRQLVLRTMERVTRGVEGTNKL